MPDITHAHPYKNVEITIGVEADSHLEAASGVVEALRERDADTIAQTMTRVTWSKDGGLPGFLSVLRSKVDEETLLATGPWPVRPQGDNLVTVTAVVDGRIENDRCQSAVLDALESGSYGESPENVVFSITVDVRDGRNNTSSFDLAEIDAPGPIGPRMR